jgi:DNA-binding NarL/FixJ family response regulator
MTIYLMMPEITGMEVYEKVAAEYPELAERFVFMTGGVFTARGQEFMKEFRCQVYEKQIEPKTLIRIVDEAIHGSAEQTALTG